MSIYNPQFDKKPVAATPLTGSEIILLSQGGAAVNATVTAFFSGLNAAAIGALMTTWLTSLPTSPSPTPGWWNNAGMPNFS